MKFTQIILIIWGTLFSATFCACNAKPEKATLTIYTTTDVHGSIFNYDLKQNRPAKHSLANVSQYLKNVRQQGQTDYILLDGGDFLQGQPSNYYFNFIDTATMNVVPRVINYLNYDAVAVGNHDIETGHRVYDKVRRELRAPWLSANIINIATGEPYFTPYLVIYRQGLKIAILGMTTPGIPQWLPRHLWSGLEFEDMIETAKTWVPRIQEKENPDILIGLFHSGIDYTYGGANAETPRNENAGLLVASQVDGFDVVILGHDHQEKAEVITNDSGHPVAIINAGSQAASLGKVTITLNRGRNGYEKEFYPEIIDMQTVGLDQEYVSRFNSELETAKAYIDTVIGTFTENLPGGECLFGPSAFVDLIHNAQLETTGAAISFCSVLQKHAYINKGSITIRDMFNLYKFENGLYTMTFTGKEIQRYLEYASSLQYNTMRSETDHLLLFKQDSSGSIFRNRQGNPILASECFNYSSAAGIRYTIDVSKEPGNRVEIHSMSDGRPFFPDSTYRVAINSYQGNGGGGHLTQGMGLSKDNLPIRIREIQGKDIRYYLTKYISKRRTITPECRNDWKVIPGSWFQKGKEQDYKLLYKK